MEIDEIGNISNVGVAAGEPDDSPLIEITMPKFDALSSKDAQVSLAHFSYL
jgi:hypothetical protein